MWTYEQSTGRMFNPNGELAGTGYSGSPEGKNNTLMQAIKNVGPIPIGTYAFGSPFDSLTHGKFVLSLTPDPYNEMFTRAGFLVHGDSVTEPGTASEGCIIMPRTTRELMAASTDRFVKVVDLRPEVIKT